MAQILEAAAAVLVEKGYEATSTNLIAAKAGISPGSLYQFYRNKEEIAEALARSGASAFSQALDQAFLLEVSGLPVAAMVDRIVDTLVDVNLSHPVLRVVFRGWDAPPALAQAISPLQNSILARVEAIIERRVPEAPDADRRVFAKVVIEIFRGLVPLVLLSNGDPRRVLLRELKRALSTYIAAVQAEVLTVSMAPGNLPRP